MSIDEKRKQLLSVKQDIQNMIAILKYHEKRKDFQLIEKTKEEINDLQLKEVELINDILDYNRKYVICPLEQFRTS